MKVKSKKVVKNNFKKDKPQRNYFDIIINEDGAIYIEPWDALLDEIFVKNNKLALNKDTTIYRYCG